MARPPAYRTLDGTIVPGVTTILGRFKEAGGLIHWAWEQGRKGKDYREEKDIAANAGTLAHAAVEAHIRKEQFQWPVEETEVSKKARVAYGAFLEWADQTKLQVTHTEVSMVSEKHRFGGTLDAMLIRGKRSLGDWKTSNGIYGEYLCQLAAYAILWEEHYPGMPIEGGFHLLRFDKTFGDFHHHFYSELDKAKEAFILMRKLYDIDKEIKGRAK